MMRHAATRAILERDDCIIVASVSCIYGIGSVETYTAMTVDLAAGDEIDPRNFMAQLVELQYTRNDIAFSRGTFRVRGDTIEVFPAHYDDTAWRFDFFGDEIDSITEFDPLTGKTGQALENVRIYANSHYVTPRPTVNSAIKGIKDELNKRLAFYESENRLLEAQRLAQRTEFDLEMLAAQGFCTGIENYSRYLTGRAPGEPPPTLFEYLPEDALLFTDESHVTVPQIGAMSKGDANRKGTLAEHGFRLPSCIDNRPLKFEEWDAMRPQTVHVSATPGPWEMQRTDGVFTEQVIRPTGLIDPPVEIRPVAKDGASQVDDVIDEVRKTTARGYRSLVTTLTKKMSEDLTEYMHEQGIRVRYMHSDIDTIERIEIIRDLRLGVFDVLIGINLLREGLDIPECAFVGILDADKEGFLRSETSLVQTIGLMWCFTLTASQAPCSGPWMKPPAAAPAKSLIMKSTALPRKPSPAVFPISSAIAKPAKRSKMRLIAGRQAGKNAAANPAKPCAACSKWPKANKPNSSAATSPPCWLISKNACSKRRRIWSSKKRHG